ncbi:hypothetical protein QAD02_011665 [Eretmocerus hayati]|uniref:Uncharacterized protein n=1 Tax=Eretmocerus hayati TaxID=131215 RepID=A0ACC2NX67_9HYME|nr:hypothetical protein QAD02_011665 [Eretmocerus hayati]
MANKRTHLREVNPYLACPLCRGYLIDATTVVECLHSFCRSCILKHLKKDACCPSCNLLLNTAKPNIKADKTLQDIVYKLVPGLYHKEMRRRREFYSKHPEAADTATPEQRGEDVSGRLIFAPEDAISLSLEYLPIGADPLTLLANGDGPESTAQQQKQPSSSSSSSSNATAASESASTADSQGKNVETSAAAMANKRYLQCPALVTIAHLKKFLALKYSVDVTRYNIDICHRRAPLPEHWTLMDVAYIFAWKRNAPIRFFYRITQEERLEAPPNDRPSTPGVGASQPLTSSEAVDNSKAKHQSKIQSSTEHQQVVESTKKKQSAQQQMTTEHLKRQSSSSSSSTLSQKNSTHTSKHTETEKPREMLAKRSTPVTKSSKSGDEINGKVQPVKSPLKIMKSADGRYQVLSTPTLPPPPPPPPPSAEFSVVKIGDGANSKGGVKITLKQCSPGTNSSNSNNSSSAKKNEDTSISKKPKVISNVLLRNSSSEKLMVEQMQQDLHKQERQKRKVSFVPEKETTPSTTPKQSQPQKKGLETNDKKQFLHSFRLTTNRHSSASNSNINSTNNTTPIGSNSTSNSPKKPEPQLSVEDQVKSIINKSLASRQQQQQSELTTPVKVGSTNIAERLADSKQLVSAMDTSPSSLGSKIASESKQQQQPIDVYAFPSEPPSPVPAGAVKRKCPPGLPIFEARKRQQQYQPGKKASGTSGSAASRGGPAPKCYRNQSNRPIFPKPPAPPAAASPVRPQQKLPNIIGSPINANLAAVVSPPIVTSTSPKVKPLISDDTRNLLDGCGLNIPASLSITLTASKSPNQNESPSELRTTKEVTRQNPSITLNDKSVDPRVLKALKSGQIKMPATNVKPKGRQKSPVDKQGPPAKKKKEDSSPRSNADLSGQKKPEIQPLKIPTPTGKFKVKPPPTWSQSNSPSPGVRDDLPPGLSNGQVVTLSGGQRFYRAPPGSLTPAAHRIADIPTPTRAPVYAPFFGAPSSSPRPTPNFSSNFPTLQDLYALSQAPNLQQFHNDTRMRQIAAKTPKDSSSPSANSTSNLSSVNSGKSHLAAQCPPIKPARSSGGTFAVPIAKPPSNAVKIISSESSAASKESCDVTRKGEIRVPAGIDDSTGPDSKEKKAENSEKVSTQADSEQTEKCASTTADGDLQNDAASPRVTSTASPSPPPSIDEIDGNSSDKLSRSSKPDELQPSSTAEVTSSNKSPESPDSSSVVTEGIGSSSDSTKQTSEKAKDSSSLKNADVKCSNDEELSEEKLKTDSTEFKKPMTSEALQERFLAAFPSNEWANNPVAAKQFGNFLKTLSSMQTDNSSKNVKTVE